LTSNSNDVLDAFSRFGASQVNGHASKEGLVVVSLSESMPIAPWRAQDSIVPILDTTIAERSAQR
jgi:hypothetical protein